jgi:hypothetical protein
MHTTHLRLNAAKVNVLASNVDFEHEDFVLIEALFDANGNQAFICYGFDWKGTWAAGFLIQVISPNIQAYTNIYYIFHWIDTNGDGIPQASEMIPIPA